MEIFLEYPQSGYIKNVKRAVNAGNIIHVSIAEKKTRQLVQTTLTELKEDAESTASCIGFFTRWFRLVTFLTGHFYAGAAEYSFSFKENDKLVITYAKNT